MIGNRLKGARSAAAARESVAKPPAGVLGSAERPGVAIVIPRTHIAAWMTLVRRGATSMIRSDVRKHFLELGYSPADLLAMGGDLVHDYNAEIAVRTLAIAIRTPEDHAKPLDTLQAWRDELDDEQISSLWVEYQSLVERLDPIGADVELAPEELAQLEAAAKKKDAAVLISFGLRKLARFAISSGERPSN